MTDLPGIAGELNLEVFDVGPIRAHYRPMQSGSWELKVLDAAPCRDYSSPLQMTHGLALLTRGEDTWMLLTPAECKSQEIGVHGAREHAAIFGLGMGWTASQTALREEVTRVTIVERDAEAIALHRELDLSVRLPGGVGKKVRIVCSPQYGTALDVATRHSSFS